MPDDWKAWAEAKVVEDKRDDLLPRIPNIARVFFNHWTSAPGARGLKSNWRRTWENWILREVISPPRGRAQYDALEQTLKELR